MPRLTRKRASVVTLDPNGGYLYVGNQGGAAGIQAFGIASGSLNTIFTYSVGGSPTSIANIEVSETSVAVHGTERAS